MLCTQLTDPHCVTRESYVVVLLLSHVFASSTSQHCTKSMLQRESASLPCCALLTLRVADAAWTVAAIASSPLIQPALQVVQQWRHSLELE